MIVKYSEILKSPRFWAAVLTVVFVLISTYVPAVAAKLDQATVINAVTALVAFIAASSVASNPSYIDILKSLRFWSLIVSLVFVFVRTFIPGFPVSEADIQMLVLTLGVGSVGVSYRPIGESK